MPTALEARLQALLAQADELPTLPAVALEVLRLCRAEETTLDDLARSLSSDPALAARLLRFANSSLYGSGEEVRTLQRATLVLGMKTVQLMSLSFSLVNAVPREGRAGTFDYATYWRRSLVRAVGARSLASLVQLPAQDEAFLAGLIAEIGLVVLARCLPEPCGVLMAECAQRQLAWPTGALERECLGFDHGDVGGVLLERWQLPGVLRHAVRHGCSAEIPAELPAEIVTLVRVLVLAGDATELLTQPDPAGALARMQTRAQEWFGLGSDELCAYLNALEAPIRETAGLLELKLPAGRGHDEILAAAREELVRRSLGQARELASLRTVSDLEHRAQKLAAPEHRDPLTESASPVALEFVLEHELRARLDGNLTRPLGLLLLALDRFEELVDEEARLDAQRRLAACLAQAARPQDLHARLSPGRFALLSGDANPFGLRALAERLRGEVERLPGGPEGRLLRVSIGGACLGRVRSMADGPALREVVERLLVRAQARGGNQVEVHASLLQPR